MKTILCIVISLAQVLCTWLISEQNLAPGFPDTDGWSVTGSYCSYPYTTNCNGYRILGGYGCFAAGSRASRNFNIAHHWQVNIRINFWMLDSWDDESLVVTIGDTTIVRIRNLVNGSNICGNSGWLDEMRYVNEIKQNHYDRYVLVSFSSTLDQDPYDESWGISDFTIAVEPCNPTCNQCQGQDAFQCLNCWPNADFIAYSGSLGFCRCTTGYYTVSENVPCRATICSQCLPCDSTCETCSGGDKYSCVKCKSNLYKQYYGAVEVNYNYSDPNYQKTLCVSDCIAQNYYKDSINRECLICYSTCKTCSSQLEYECLTCYNGYYLDGVTTGKCVTSCSSSYYKDDTDKKCKKCNSNCLECLDNQPNFCSKCKNGSFLTIGTGVCVADCGVGQWGRSTDWTCQYCDSTCQNCTSNPTNCTSCTGVRYLYGNQCLTVCPDGYYKGAGNLCTLCDSSCKTCDQGSNTDCLSCSSSYGYLKDRSCIQCPNQFYGDSSDQTCKPCNSSCYNCRAGTNLDCVSCSTNYLEDFQCKPVCFDGFWGNGTTHTCDLCDSNCKTCKLYGPNIDCLSCSSPLYLKDLRCITTCNPIGEYGDDTTRECTPCESTCYTCNQKNYNNCVSCTGTRYLYNNQCLVTCPAPSYYGLNNVCISTCPDGMYADDNTRLCQPCDPICPTCFGGTVAECKSCASPYYLEGSTCQTFCPSDKYKNDSNRTCTYCNSECLECDGGTDSDCTKCDPAKYFGNKKCYSSCPAPYFSSTVTMECVLPCPKGYWGDTNDPQRLCQLCHLQCEECTAGTFTACSKCKAGFYLYNTSCDSCPMGYYPNDGTRTCDNCSTTCKSCDGPSQSNCLSCNNDRYYLPGQKRCYDICPDPYFSHFTEPNCLLSCPTNYTKSLYGNTLTRRCENCNVACVLCTGGTYFDCNGCATNYFYYDKDKSCVLKCPDGTYSDIQQMKCLACDKSCATCNGGLNTNCQSCLLPNVLYNSQCIYDCPSPLYKDEDLKECVSDCTKKFPNKFADEKEKKCKYCNKYCSKCTGPLNSQCQKCKVPYLKYETSCLEQCVSGTYYDSTKKVNETDDDCKQCNSDCTECYGPYNTNCLSCNSTLYMLKESDDIKCLVDCPDLYIKSTEKMTCEACPIKTYFYQGKCYDCHYSCETCSGSFSNQCVKCAQTRGTSSSRSPNEGVCSCQKDYIETYKELCESSPSAVSGIQTSTQAFAISGTTASALIGMLGRNMFFLYNMLEIAQFTSYFRYININFPLDLNTLFDKLYISHISTLSNINSSNSNANNSTSSSSNSGKVRILEDTAFNNSNFLFDLRGKNLPLWKSFFLLILLNFLSWMFVGGLNLLVGYWKIKYNQSHLLEKIRCWTSFGFPIQIFLRTSMEAILFIVLCFKESSQVEVFDWIIASYFMIILGSLIIAMIYQNTRNIKLDQYDQPVIQVKKIRVNKVADNKTQIETSSHTYPHPFRTLWDFTKKDKVSRNYYLIYLISKILMVILVVELVHTPSKQILSFAIIKLVLFIIMVILRPMINKWYNGVTILNEFLQSLICFLTYGCTMSSSSQQNKLGYGILISILVLFIVNLIGTIISLIFIIKNLIVSLLRKNKESVVSTETRTGKPTRVQVMSKANKLDLSYLDESTLKKESQRNIIDNASSTVQMQKDNQDDFDQSKSIHNQSVFQYDYDNPFYFLEKQQSSEQERERKKKKSKKFTKEKSHRSQNNNQVQQHEAEDFIQGNNIPNSPEKKKDSQQTKIDDDYDINKNRVANNNSNTNREIIPRHLQQEQTDRVIRGGGVQNNQSQFREGQNQDIDDLSDYLYHQPGNTVTPITQFVSNSPIPHSYPAISPIPQDDDDTPTPYHNQRQSDYSPVPLQKSQLLPNNTKLDKIEDFEQQQSKETEGNILGNRNGKQLSQLQIKHNKATITYEGDDSQSIQQIPMDTENKDTSNSNIISFLNDLTLNKLKNKKQNNKKIVKI